MTAHTETARALYAAFAVGDIPTVLGGMAPDIRWVVVHDFVSEGDMVVALGDYSGTFKATGKSFTAPFAHVWQFRDGKLMAFHQHTDTFVHRASMA